MRTTEQLAELLHEATEIIKQIQDFGPPEPSPNACWFCDMGGAGYSSKGEGYHDDTCLWGQARNFLEKVI